MRHAIDKFCRDERGVVVVMVGAIIALLLVFSVMAIDATQMMLVRTQLQNAADAGALAGALKGALTDDTTEAQNEAILAAGANTALLDSANARNTMSPVVIADSDVTFPQARKIAVTTHRTEATGDQFMNYFMRIFDANNLGPGNMTASAAAEWARVCGGKCLMPWAPPDRWDDLDGDGMYDMGEPYDPVTTGYTDADLGAPVTIVLGNGNQEGFGEFEYYSVDFPPINKGNPISGDNRYRDWMCQPCLDASFAVEPGDSLRVEPGKAVGPNSDGLDCIIARDPDATWDAASGQVISAFPISPRIVKCAVFDPSKGLASYGGGKRVVVTKIIVLFIESTSNNNQQITGRFMRLAEPDGVVCANQNDPSFLFQTHLSE
jgi:Flp pilus assembly protein TadG